MRRFLATLAVTAIGTTLVGVGLAAAAELEITPEAPAEGQTELTISVGDFGPDTPIYAVPCDVPASRDAADVTTDSCDVSEVASATTDASGNATIVVEWTIPADGIAVYVGDEARKDQAAIILMPAIDTPEPEVAVLGTTVVQESDELPETGPREVVLLLTVAALVIGVGLALRGAEHIRTSA